MSTRASRVSGGTHAVGNDRILFGIILGVLAFWLPHVDHLMHRHEQVSAVVPELEPAAE